MKSIAITCLLSLSVFAQAPAKKAAPRPAAPAGGGAASSALLNPAALKARAPENFKVAMTTTKGDVVIEVHRAWAPLGADRFYNLVKAGFFNDAAFFRVLPGFVVQFGLNGNPAVNKAWADTKFRDDPVKETNKKGTITFATAGANTRTTQLFINLGENQRLDSMGFSPFGTVTEGMDVVEKIYSGYGESPDQEKITNQGKAYLSKNFPQMDSIKTAKVIPIAASEPVKK